jgi:predicted transcriptional regulator
MHDYFQHIVTKLTIDDMNILGILTDNDATATFKAMRKKDVFNKSGLSEANYRKVIYRLDAINFIETVTGSKEHMFFITNFGLTAVEQSIEGVVN